ncbi:MAG TPA: hypothetical protein VFQ80_12790 [Thermomicrobiales bacterium]|jgi:hypothetical protein|nr:hypothetical protein [Thermomicrobiales bacterium]
MRRSLRSVAGWSLALLFVVAWPLVASAHEHRTIANGQYTMVVGFLDEPTFAGLKNGLDLTVMKLGGTPTAGTAAASSDDGPQGAPVTGLEKTLKAEVMYSDQTMELTLEPRDGAPGAYNGVFFPMKPGDYSFRIYGTINGAQVDETFTTSPSTFGPVEDPTPLEFPKATGAAGAATAATGFLTGASGPGVGTAAGLGLLLGFVVVGRLRQRTSRAHPSVSA